MLASLPVTISLAGRVGQHFDPHTMIAGFQCHTRGVELSSAGRDRIDARVRGKRTRDVVLSVRADGALAVTCSCPAQSYGQTHCKHVWAALLEIDRQGAFEELRGTRRALDLVAADAVANANAPAAKKKTAAAVKKKKAAAKKRP